MWWVERPAATLDALEAVVAIAEQTSEHGALQQLVDVARSLTSASYSAALLLGSDGNPSALAHAGMTAGQVAALPHLPRPVGLLGIVLTGRATRLADMSTHPSHLGFPDGHVPRQAFLGVPITADGTVLGGLYLTRPPGGGEFTAADECIALTLARQASAAVQAARAQSASADLLLTLGASSPRSSDEPAAGPSLVIQRLLAAARDVLGMDLTFLSQLHGDAQTFTHVESGPGAPAVPLVEGTTIDAADGYCTLMIAGEIPASVPDVAAHPVLGAMPVTSALGVGSYCGVPVRLPDGALYGTLCGLHGSAGTAPDSGQLQAMHTIAGLIGVQLQVEQQQAQERRDRAQAFQPMVDGAHRATVLQPIVDLRTRATVGYEALSRFTDDYGAARRPDAVFAEARELGLAVQLEQAAARSALSLLPDLPAQCYLSVNLSPHALLDPATFDLLAAATANGHGRRVVVEITEHEQVPDYPALLRVIDALRARGLRLAVDDTGAGFASLQHVTRLRPDIVKLDIAFVRDIHLDAARRAVARAMIAFAADLGATLIAEGIETADELAELVRLGAPLGQGYHLGRPAAPQRRAPVPDPDDAWAARPEARAATVTG